MDPSAAVQVLRANFSAASAGDGRLLRCWSHQDCRRCLVDDGCSWCPFTWACVPNSCPLPLLAPAYDTHLCPLPAERWELRSRPFGCRVSSTTSLTALAAFVAGMLLLSWLALNFVALRRWRRYTAQKPGLDHVSVWPGWTSTDAQLRQPLLAAQPAQ